MEIETLYKIGDKIDVAGEKKTIIGCHIYVSDAVQTERYYLGKGVWLTIDR